MLGHRNTSVLFFRQGTLSKSESGSTSKGFIHVIDLMRRRVPGLERKDVLLALKCSHNSSGLQVNFNWSEIATRGELSIAEIESAYKLSIDETWRVISSWLNETLPNHGEIDAVVKCGGANFFFKNQIKSFFPQTPVHIPAGIDKELLYANGLYAPIPQTFSHKSEREFTLKNYPTRFADVWGLFAVITGYSPSLTIRRIASVTTNG